MLKKTNLKKILLNAKKKMINIFIIKLSDKEKKEIWKKIEIELMKKKN